MRGVTEICSTLTNGISYISMTPISVFMEDNDHASFACHVSLRFAVQFSTFFKKSQQMKENPSVTGNFTPKASSEARQNQSLLTFEGTVTRDIYKKNKLK